MHLNRKDMINRVIETFKNSGYKSAINKRLCFGLNIAPLTCIDCISLNDVVKELDNNMLYDVEFYPSMFIDNFDQYAVYYMCRGIGKNYATILC